MIFLERLLPILQSIGFTLQRILPVVPPYHRIEGTLDAKESPSEDRYFILVNSEIVEVDWLTYEILVEGEPLRIRVTHDNKAISIDRLLP